MTEFFTTSQIRAVDRIELPPQGILESVFAFKAQSVHGVLTAQIVQSIMTVIQERLSIVRRKVAFPWKNIPSGSV